MSDSENLPSVSNANLKGKTLDETVANFVNDALGRSFTNNSFSVDHSRNGTIEAGAGSDQITVADSYNFTINTGQSRIAAFLNRNNKSDADNVRVFRSHEIDVNTGDDGDLVEVNGSNNVRINLGVGNDMVEVGEFETDTANRNITIDGGAGIDTLRVYSEVKSIQRTGDTTHIATANGDSLTLKNVEAVEAYGWIDNGKTFNIPNLPDTSGKSRGGR